MFPSPHLFMTGRRESAGSAFLMRRISLFARDSREKRDGVGSFIFASHPRLLVSLIIHERRFTRKSSVSGLAAEMLMNHAG